MSGRIFAIMALLVVLGVTTAREMPKHTCHCRLFWSQPQHLQQTFQLVFLNKTWTFESECDYASCESKCKEYMHQEYGARSLTDDWSFRLGKFLCGQSKQLIRYYAPENIFMEPFFVGCPSNQKYTEEVGELCCYSCDGNIYYNPHCQSEPADPILNRPGVSCDV